MKATILIKLTDEEIDDINQELVDEPVDNFWLYDNRPIAGYHPNGWWWRTTNGNTVTVASIETGEFRVEIDARRHALHDSGNVAGAAMSLLGLMVNGIPTSRAKAALVERYDSMRADCPWWDYDLDHPAVREYRRKAAAAGREVPARLVFQDGKVRPDWNEPPVPSWQGLEYRRAAANGVQL